MAGRRRNRPNNTNNNNGGGRPQHNKATVFDSNGPDVRIRGTAFQIVEKYMALAKDSASSGDRVMAENYLQHAEHYQRLIGSWADEAPVRTYDQDGREGREGRGDVRDVRRAAPQMDSEPEMGNTAVDTRVDEEDLSLPASILGVGAQSISEDQPTRAASRAVVG